MRRLTTGLALLALAFAFSGCGGSSSVPAPGNGNGNGNGNGGDQASLVNVAAPDSISGDHSVAIKPGQLNVVAGGTQAQLEATLDQLGYSLVSYKAGGHATVEVPAGSEQAASIALEKQYNIVSAEPVHVINTPNASYDLTSLSKGASFYPLDPWYADRIGGLDVDDNGTPADNTDDFLTNTHLMFGQGQPMNIQGFPTAWDVSLNAGVAAEPVSIALIDAGWFDYSTPGFRPGFDDTRLDAVNSGSVDGAGTFTAGLAAATWDLDDDADPTTRDFPFRDTGELMLGVLAADFNSYLPWDIVDFNGDAAITPDEIWNEGIAGINPNASYILIKTGTLSGPTWTFSDNEIAESIDHAVASGANIILLGMFGNGPVGANVSTAIQNARDNDILVIAPAGDVVDSFNGTGFDNAPVDITANSVTPASDPNCVSVAGTGLDKIDPASLGQVNGVDNGGTGWSPLFNPPFDSPFTQVASWSNTGATIAGEGFGVGYSFAPFITSGDGTVGNEVRMFPGENYRTTTDRFSTVFAAAYVAGAASQVYQILSNVGGAPPTDDQVLAELTGTVQFSPLAGTATGLLNAGLAATSAVNGGNLVTQLPAIRFTQEVPSQPIDAVTRGTDFSIQVTCADGTAPFTLSVDWGDGAGLQAIAGWNNGDTVTLTGGYATLGIKGLTLQVEDANNLIDTDAFAVHVINPMAASITITDASDAPAVISNLAAGTPYRFNASPANVFTGGGNVTTYNWDFDGDGSTDDTGPAPGFTYPSALGTVTVTLTITETLRPDTVRTLDVTVN